MTSLAHSSYDSLIQSIGTILSQSRQQAYTQINHILVQTYRHIGNYIVEYEQQGNEKADYGSKLFDRLSKDLTNQHGKGFSRSNLFLIRQFYLLYPKIQTLSGQLSRSHRAELVSIDDELERSFYEKQCVREKRSIRELKRQKQSGLFMRLASSKDKEHILSIATHGQTIEQASDIIKDPYILEFLNLPDNHKESELEESIIANLQTFLLELGKGFAFVGRQYRITLANEHYFVDLVFYHRILKCFVLIDLKINKTSHADIGQMNMYLNYFKKEEMTEGDNEPIGIILSTEKDETMIEYALGGLSNQIFASKYKLYLPDKKLLQKELQKLLNE